MSAHGHHSLTYRTWSGMKSRCHNPNDTNYKKYDLPLIDEYVPAAERQMWEALAALDAGKEGK